MTSNRGLVGPMISRELASTRLKIALNVPASGNSCGMIADGFSARATRPASARRVVPAFVIAVRVSPLVISNRLAMFMTVTFRTRAMTNISRPWDELS
jgi:hypothetical protein